MYMKSMILLSLDLLKKLDGCLIQLFTGEIYRISEDCLVKQEVRLVANDIMYLDTKENETLTVSRYQQIWRLYNPMQDLAAERNEISDFLCLTNQGIYQLLPEIVDELDLYGLALTRPKQYKFIKELRGYLGYYKKIDLSWYFNS
ncbi:hypothetical protein [uncultured Enterococcus sp.]|uniref:hypothetical protein n=1 Tax=uncultured Enterococcus sp. TaxID=167972 RepID=UPI0037484C68